MEQSRISRIGQVKVYTGKCFRAFKNEKGWKSFVSSAIIAIIISWVVGDRMFETPGATKSGAFALICACIWMGIFNSIQSICRERAIIKREHRTGLHMYSYITAHMIYEMALCFAEALITTIIIYFMRKPNDVGGLQGIFLPVFIELFVTFFLVIYASDILGMLVSCVVKNETQAMTVMPFVLILQLVMSGAIFVLEGAASGISNLTISKWGVNAICSIANINLMYRVAEEPINPDYAFNTGHLTQLWLILLVFTLIYGIIGIVSLKLFIDKDKR